MTHRRFIGTIVSDKMDQTVVVEVARVKRHPKYLKQFRLRRKFKAHNPGNQYHAGEVVEIAEMRPLSREKRWTVIRKLTAGSQSSVTSGQPEGGV